MSTKDGLDFEAIAREIRKTFCSYSPIKEKLEHIQEWPTLELDKLITQALKEAYKAGKNSIMQIDENGKLSYIPTNVVLPGRANQCAHDASPSDFDKGEEFGWNGCLDEIQKLNPHLFGEGK